MVEIGNMRLCESCFAECKSDKCPKCGFESSLYVPQPDVIPCGSILLGKYIVGKVLGKGGFGITYLAYDIKQCKVIAIKEYYPIEFAVRENNGTKLMVTTSSAVQIFSKGLKRFYEEARLIAHLNASPNVVHVYEFFYENNTAYFTMEYLSGMSVKDYVNSFGVINSSQALYIALCVSEALGCVHRLECDGEQDNYVLHRDVSPDNIMICDDGSIKLIDFGAARQVYPEGSQLLSVIIKPGFAPIEQYQKKGKQGPWTDIYSLGNSLFYALTLKVPQDPMERYEDDEDYKENIYGIHSGLWEVIKKTVMIKYADRYADTDELLAALGGITDIVPEKIILKKEKPKIPAIVWIGGGAALLVIIIILICLILMWG